MKRIHWPCKAICLTPHAVFMPIVPSFFEIFIKGLSATDECIFFEFQAHFRSISSSSSKKKKHRILKVFSPQLHSHQAYFQEKTLTPNALHFVFSQILKATPLVLTDIQSDDAISNLMWL